MPPIPFIFTYDYDKFIILIPLVFLIITTSLVNFGSCNQLVDSFYSNQSKNIISSRNVNKILSFIEMKKINNMECPHTYIQQPNTSLPNVNYSNNYFFQKVFYNNNNKEENNKKNENHNLKDFWQNHWQKSYAHYTNSIDISKWYNDTIGAIENISKFDAQNKKYGVVYKNGENMGKNIAKYLKNYPENLNSEIGIVFQSVHKYSKPFFKATSSLKQILGYPANINMYISSRKSITLKPHTDRTPTFILQVDGSKTWDLCVPSKCDQNSEFYKKSNMVDRAELSEVTHNSFDGCNNFEYENMIKTSNCVKIIMNPGDLLYVPRGIAHRCVASADKGSIHLTFSIQDREYSWRSLLVSGFRKLLKKNSNIDIKYKVYQNSLSKISKSLNGIYFHRAFPMWINYKLLLSNNNEEKQNMIYDDDQNDMIEIKKYIEKLSIFLYSEIKKTTKVQSENLLNNYYTYSLANIINSLLDALRYSKLKIINNGENVKYIEKSNLLHSFAKEVLQRRKLSTCKIGDTIKCAGSDHYCTVDVGESDCDKSCDKGTTSCNCDECTSSCTCDDSCDLCIFCWCEPPRPNGHCGCDHSCQCDDGCNRDCECDGGFTKECDDNCDGTGCSKCKNAKDVCMCPAGYERDGNDFTLYGNCRKCAAGKIKTGENRNDCVDCPSGKWQGLKGQTSCIDCTECLEGYQEYGNLACGASDKTSDIYCEICIPGKYQKNVNNKKVCVDCSAGYYSDEAGQTTCKACPNGKWTRSRSIIRASDFRNEISDCVNNPEVFSILPPTSSIAGNVETLICGSNFGDENNTIVLSTEETKFLSASTYSIIFPHTGYFRNDGIDISDLEIEGARMGGTWIAATNPKPTTHASGFHKMTSNDGKWIIYFISQAYVNMVLVQIKKLHSGMQIGVKVISVGYYRVLSTAFDSNKIPIYWLSKTKGTVATCFDCGNYGVYSLKFAPIAVTGINSIQVYIGPSMEWKRTSYVNSTCLKVVSDFGFGEKLDVKVKINDLESGSSNVIFSYLNPRISSILPPDVNGGTVRIIGTSFSSDAEDKTQVLVTGLECIDSGELITELCKDVVVVSLNEMQCQLTGKLSKGLEHQCMNKTVQIKTEFGDSDYKYSNKYPEICYNGSVAELKGVSNQIVTMQEGTAKTYKIRLDNSFKEEQTENVTVHVTSNNDGLFEEGYGCTVTPSVLKFTANDDSDREITVQSANNQIDEVHDLNVAYSCVITHTITSVNSYYKHSPPKLLRLDIIDDDIANFKLIPIFPNSTMDIDDAAKKIGPICMDEGMDFSYGIQLSTEPMGQVKVHGRFLLNYYSVYGFDNNKPKLEPNILSTPIAFDKYNWQDPIIVTITFAKDHFSNFYNTDFITVDHWYSTDDGAYRIQNKVNKKINCSVKFRVTDVNSVGINYYAESNGINPDACDVYEKIDVFDLVYYKEIDLEKNSEKTTACLQDEKMQRIFIKNFESQPFSDVILKVNTSFGYIPDWLQVEPKHERVSATNWNNVNKKFVLKIVKDIPATSFNIFIEVMQNNTKCYGSINCHKYANLQTISFPVIIRTETPPSVKDPIIFQRINDTALQIEWFKNPKDPLYIYELEWGYMETQKRFNAELQNDFQNFEAKAETNKAKDITKKVYQVNQGTTTETYQIITTNAMLLQFIKRNNTHGEIYWENLNISMLPIHRRMVYIRMRLIYLDVAGEWRDITQGNSWKTSSDCTPEQYLNTTSDFPMGMDRTNYETLIKKNNDTTKTAKILLGGGANRDEGWYCSDCPSGASCKGDVQWTDVKAKFGYWRLNPNLEEASQFVKCLFPAACLGVSNREYEGQFNSTNETHVDFDPSMVDHPESCATIFGYKNNKCRGEGQPRCRLCATCAHGFKRRVSDGMARCDKCPDKTLNKFILVAGVLVVIILMFLLIRLHLESGGKRTTKEMYQVIIINYLQLTSLTAGMDVPWPDAIGYIFAFQSVISTIGEHLISPDCEVQSLQAAELIYMKQSAYMLLPWIMMLLSWIFWRVIGLCHGRNWTYRGGDDRSPSLQDGCIATIVFLFYLLYPTLCKSAFTLINCVGVGASLEDKVNNQYLLVDLQEPCYRGRHWEWIVMSTIPQILLYVIGLPLFALFIIHRNMKRKRLQHPITQFCYGMLYSGYNYNSWWWDIVIAGRKAVVAFITSYLNGRFEVHATLLVLALAIVFNELGQPYGEKEHLGKKDKGRNLQQLDTMANATTFLTVWVGLFFIIYPHCEHRQFGCVILLIALIGVNVLFLIYCFLTFASASIDEQRSKWVKIAQRIRKYFICCCGCKILNMKERRGFKDARKRLRSDSSDPGRHTNPLKYRKSFSRRVKKDTENPFHISRTSVIGIEMSDLDIDVQNPMRRKQSSRTRGIRKRGRTMSIIERINDESDRVGLRFKSTIARAKRLRELRQKVQRQQTFKKTDNNDGKIATEVEAGVQEYDEEIEMDLGWKKVVNSTTGYNFYYNVDTGSVNDKNPFSLPENWHMHYDLSSKNFYYSNPETGEVTWDRTKIYNT